MAHSAQGFTGTVDQVAWSKLITLQSAATFRLAAPGHWAPTVNTGVARTLTVAPGQAACCGVLDTTDVATDVAFVANGGSSTRIDALVARFDWPTMTCSFVPVQGTTVAPTILSTGSVADNARITQIPGVRYDAVLAYVPITVGAATLPVPPAANSFTDVRVTDGTNWPAGRPMFVQQTAPASAPDGALWFQIP